MKTELKTVYRKNPKELIEKGWPRHLSFKAVVKAGAKSIFIDGQRFYVKNEN